jgi:hypothetical protein
MDFRQRNLFDNDLNVYIAQKYARDSVRYSGYISGDSTYTLSPNSSTVLQEYDPVLVAFPLGLVIGFPVAAHLDIFLHTQSFWEQQSAIIETRGPDRIELSPQDTVKGELRNTRRKYVVQANLAGCGLKFYFPTDLLSIDQDKSLYLSYTQFWNLGNSEIYSDAGSRSLRSPLFGVGYEISLGYQLSIWRQIGILGNLAITRFTFPARGTWSSVLLQDLDKEMEAEINSLKFNFQFIYQLGGFPEKAETDKKPPDKKPEKPGKGGFSRVLLP